MPMYAYTTAQFPILKLHTYFIGSFAHWICKYNFKYHFNGHFSMKVQRALMNDHDYDDKRASYGVEEEWLK